ncbi:hypothetical protein PsorP6_003088 [Peronosclerospora sorghi]|uniref:Uncharacterized protein n=1 Tax=Peronosclerospora sorghi TaxID=230839 RepID=A0ACC0VPV2_9STRA|nr:hypothetical protein PsorP6_003088 [Peronosclerospora sorghi]
MVVKCAGELQQDGANGRFKVTWNEWQAARQLRSISRYHPNVVTKENTKTSDFVGNAQYMATEVAAQVSYIPVVADVWSLGGDPLLEFGSPTSQEFKTIRAMGCCGVLKSWGMDSQLSSATMDLLSKMLEFDHTKRLQIMAQVLNHNRSALLGLYNTTMIMMDRAMYYQSFGTQVSFSPRDDLSVRRIRSFRRAYCFTRVPM